MAPGYNNGNVESASEPDSVEDSVARKKTAMDAKPSPYMYFAIAMAMVGAMMFGLDQGNFGNVQAFADFRQEWCVGRFGNETTCDAEHAEANHAWTNGFVLWGATLITLGAAAGALLLAPWIATTFGRRPCIAVGGGICFVGCLMASYMSFSSVPVFYAGRFITGFGVGVSCFCLPVYNAEISTPSIRGATGSLFQLNVVIGGFIACLITLFYDDWKFGMLLPGLAGAALLAGSPFIPESPRFIMETKGFEKGLKELKRTRRGDVMPEAEDMHEEIRQQESVEEVSYLDMCAQPNLRKRVIIACVLVLAQQATGVNAFLGYAATIFKSVGIDNPVLFNTIFNLIMIGGCSAGLALVDSQYGGRRCQLLGASWIMGPPLVIAGFGLLYDWPGILILLCVPLYGVGFQFAWGTIPWIYPAEIFSMAEKEKAVSLAVCLNYVANAAIIIITPFVMTWSVPGTFFFFGVLNVLNGVFVQTNIRETKGVPLEHIPELFASRRRRKQGAYSDSESNSDESNSSDSGC
mmetsp:Transcript_64089/g.206438  ORF Transcript_64089/g.206438 Transcript_64089/m.206438 type:complete len:521 (+) Transcript_64089:88-1650(+)